MATYSGRLVGRKENKRICSDCLGNHVLSKTETFVLDLPQLKLHRVSDLECWGRLVLSCAV